MYDQKKIQKRFTDVARSATFRNIVSAGQLNEKKVLDIGCSYGEHLVHFGKGSIGLTITEQEIAFGKANGIDIRHGNIEDSSFKIDEVFSAQCQPSSGWDAIFANNIFEHLFAPHYFLFRVRKLLKENGTLILGVPCVPKIALFMRFRKWRGSLSRPHINFFTGDTLQRTVERGGFRVYANRGFHFRNAFIDTLFAPVYPHFYIMAMPIPGFKYPEERMGALVENMDVVFLPKADRKK